MDFAPLNGFHLLCSFLAPCSFSVFTTIPVYNPIHLVIDVVSLAQKFGNVGEWAVGTNGLK